MEEAQSTGRRTLSTTIDGYTNCRSTGCRGQPAVGQLLTTHGKMHFLREEGRRSSLCCTGQDVQQVRLSGSFGPHVHHKNEPLHGDKKCLQIADAWDMDSKVLGCTLKEPIPFQEQRRVETGGEARLERLVGFRLVTTRQIVGQPHIKSSCQQVEIPVARRQSGIRF